MLFLDPSLKSMYDFECTVPEKHCTLQALSKEIYRITQIIYGYSCENKRIRFQYLDNNNLILWLDYSKISESTWNRDINEIKEILYRSKVSDRFQQQFSINKALDILGIHEPQEGYGAYLQVLYFFYMFNYFAFPDINVFKIFYKEKPGYVYGIDEGLASGRYVSFILSNILSNNDLFDYFLSTLHMIDMLYFYTDEKIKEMDSFRIGVEYEEKDVLKQVLSVFYNMSMRTYCDDLLETLKRDSMLFYYDPLEIPPFDIWKHTYIALDELDDFLYTDLVYKFCKQIDKKIEIREKIKFKESAAVRFLYRLLDYDLDWMYNFEQDGFLLEYVDNTLKIQPLRIAIVIKTYNDLIHRIKARICNGNSLQTFKSALTSNGGLKEGPLTTLSIRFFMLACFAEYLNATDENTYGRFRFQYLIPEINALTVYKELYRQDSLEAVKKNLMYILTKL